MRAFRIHQVASDADEHIVRRQGLIHAAVGVTLLIIAVIGLTRDVSWIAQPFYAWVWWGYIFVLDGFCAWRRADSLMTRRIHLLFPIAIWSTTFWFFFELLNARMQNWYYVGVYPDAQVGVSGVFSFLAFATVFMGIFQTYDALAAAGFCRNWRRNHERKFPKKVSYIIQVAGLIMGGLAILFPYYLAPLIWGSFTFLIDPWNYRRGTRSSLRDIECGDYGLLTRLLAAGLICGVVWESLNFFAPQKWIYTVRGLEGFKLFEMPLLGFLGFPALALDSTAGFALFASIFLGNRSWERADDLSYELDEKPPRATFWFWGLVPTHIFFWAAVYFVATPINIGSLQVELAHLDLAPQERAQLAEHGVTRPRQLLRADREELIRNLNWTESRYEMVQNQARLYTFKGIGYHHGLALESIGVRRPEDLRGRDPVELHQQLLATNQRFLPRLDFVRVWVLAAEDSGIVLNAEN